MVGRSARHCSKTMFLAIQILTIFAALNTAPCSKGLPFTLTEKLPTNLKKTAISPFLLPHIPYSRDGENFLIFQRNSC